MFTRRDGEVVSGKLILEEIPGQPEGDTYVLGYGDVFDVLFLYNDEYSGRDITVRPDGKISYPYVGEVNVAGMTVTALDSLLTMSFSDIVKDPDIAIVVKRFQPKMVYLMGEVTQPGGYPIESEISLMQAISMGRGVTPKAKLNSVLIIRRIAPAHIVGIQVDLKSIIEDHRYDMDIPIKDNDIVMVPKSVISKAEEFVASFSNILTSPTTMYLRGWQIVNQEVLYDYYHYRIEEGI